jgi:hypothetical protein
MTIKQALKHKNKLVQKINDAIMKVYSYNSYEFGETRPYDVKETLNEYFKLSHELIELKDKIHKANRPVYYKIFELSELKSQATKLKVLNCNEGKIQDRYGRTSGEIPVVNTAIINIVERDNMITSIEERIEQLQDELDTHNATTTI